MPWKKKKQKNFQKTHDLFKSGKSKKEISKELYISDQTASVHRKNIMRKLGVSSSATLIKMAFENNLL